MRIKETRDVAKMIVNLQNSEKGTSDYEDLTNKPTINGVTLEGALTSADLGVQTAPQVFTLIGTTDWLSGEYITIEDETNLATLTQMKSVMAQGGAVDLKIGLPNGSTYNVFQATPYYYENSEASENASIYGFGFIGGFGISFVTVNLGYTNNESIPNTWEIELTPLEQSGN